MKSLKNILFILAFLIVILICILVMSIKNDSMTANIYKDGKLFKTINLKNVKESYTINIEEHNTVLVENGKISMYSADCPDKLCIKQGKITDFEIPIVCLPNKIIIRIE